MNYTFEQLPQAVSDLHGKLEIIERLLLQKGQNLADQEKERWLDLNELCDYLPDKPTKATVYGWVHHSLIPYHKREHSKKLIFLQSEINSWIKSGRRKTASELQEEKKAQPTISTRRGGRRIKS